MLNIPEIKARYEADGPHVQNGAFCQGCLCVWPCGGSFLAALVTALEEAQEKREQTMTLLHTRSVNKAPGICKAIEDIWGESE
jgi:hypothetical protein